MIGRLDLDEHRKAEPDRRRIEDRDPPLDHALRLELLDAAPARRLRKVDPARHLGDGEGRILLEDGEDPDVGSVHSGRLGTNWENLPTPRPKAAFGSII